MKHVELELHHLSLPAVDNLSKEQTFSCMAGVARCSLWLGDVYHGIRIAEQLGSEQLIKECAKILEALKQAKHISVPSTLSYEFHIFVHANRQAPTFASRSNFSDI